MGLLSDVWPYKVSGRTGWPGVSILPLGEIATVISNIYPREPACKISSRSVPVTNMLVTWSLSKKASNQHQRHALTASLHDVEQVRKSLDPYENRFLLVDDIVSEGSVDILPFLDTTEARQYTAKTSAAGPGLHPTQRSVMLDKPHTGVVQLYICNSNDNHKWIQNHYPCNGPRVMQGRDRQEKNTPCNLTSVGVRVSDVFTQRTHKSLLSHWTSQQTEVLYSAAGNAKYIFWKITTRVISHSPHTHDRYTSPTMRHHVRGHYSVLSSSFLSGPITESSRMD